MGDKIGQVESVVAQRLSSFLRNILKECGYSVPQEDQPRVKFYEKDRKKRSDASADQWSPKSGWIQIYFEHQAPQPRVQAPDLIVPDTAAPSKPSQSLAPDNSTHGVYLHPAEADLLRALDRAESTPGWSFVPLKKFRDEILPSEQHASMRTDVEQQHILRSAIEKRLVLTGKVANPKNPQFPVTTIRLNRLMPEVRTALGGGSDPDLEFRPVEIRGEPLSSTVLRERR